MAEDISFCRGRDGVRIAYGVKGEGAPLVVCPALVEQFSLQHQVPAWRAFIDRLGEGMRTIQFDSRGTGLSDRDVDDFSLETRLQDLDAVVKASRVRRFALYGTLLSGPLAISYAARYPRRVSHLILYGTFCRGSDVMPWERLGPLTQLARANWPLAAQTMADMSGDLSSRQRHPEAGVHIAQLFRESSSGRVFAEGLTGGYDDDVAPLLPTIAAPTLVLHRRNDPIVPFALGQDLAGRIPNARLAPLEGAVHSEFLGDIEELLSAVDTFLGREAGRARPERRPSAAPVIILFTDIERSTAITQRLGDAPAQELVRAHDAVVRDALRSHAGDEIKHTGDGIMASFPSASAALECSIVIQRALARRNQERQTPVMNVRIGLNAGEPLREQEDLFGQAVQLARRVCDHAAPGQILTSNVVRELVAGKGFLFADQGETALRGFEDPVRLYEVSWAE